MAPLVLILSAFVWDLRAFLAHRTDLVREVYVIAEVVAGETDQNPLRRTDDPANPRLIDAFMERFATRGAGSLDIAVVVRGARRRDGTECPDDPDGTAARWCPPTVAVRWPPATDPADGLWQDAHSRLPLGGGGECVQRPPHFPPPLPREGDPFDETQAMLANEAAVGANEADWISRRMGEQEWWVVIDVCLHPGPGVFTGPLIRAGMEAMDFSSFTSRLTATWRSIHNREICTWCGP